MQHNNKKAKRLITQINKTTKTPTSQDSIPQDTTNPSHQTQNKKNQEHVQTPTNNLKC
jgi:hypothetical protein